jgi:hypothetical protein
MHCLYVAFQLWPQGHTATQIDPYLNGKPSGTTLIHNNGITLKPPVSFHGGQKYLEVRHSRLSIVRNCIFVSGVLNISDTNMAAGEGLRVIFKLISI